MKKAISAFIAIVIIMASTVLAQQQPPPPPPPAPARIKPVSEWLPFISSDGNFSLILPKKPLEMKQEVQTEIGKVPIKIFVAQNGLIAYLAMFVDYPVIFDTPGAVKSSLDGARELMLSKHGGEVISEHDISHGKFPGRDLKAKTSDGLLYARIFIVYQRVYMMMVMMPIADDKDFPQAKDTNQYFDSFKLVEEPKAPANLGSMSRLAASAEKIDPPPDFFDRPVSWREFSSADFGFSIQLPGEPFHQAAPLDPNNRKLDIQVWMAKGEDFMAQVIVQPLVVIPNEEARRNLIFKGLLNGLLEGGNIQLLSEKEISYQSHPGREYKLQLAFGQATGKAYLIGNNVYVLVAFLIGGPEKTDGAVRFFDSFTVTKSEGGHLIGDPLQGPPPPPAPTRPPGTEDLKGEPPAGAVRVSSGILQGALAVKKIEPVYPKAVRSAKAAGIVKIRVLLSEEGKLIESEVISGPELLREPALNAARQWTFRPYQLNGKPVKVESVLTFNFTLR